MNTVDSKTYVAPFIRDLCPTLTEEELIEATDNMARLIEICIEIQLEHAKTRKDKSRNQSLTENDPVDRISEQ